MKFQDAALSWIIEGYTREAGVRNLERQIGSIARSVAAEIVEGKTDKAHHHQGPRDAGPGPEKIRS